MRNRIYLVAAVLLLLCVVGFQAARPQYEYKFEHSPSENKTNDLAAQGWELVAIESAGAGRIVPTYVFKRAKQ